MVFGDDPSEGFVRGREFLHPRLAIAFRVPPNFRLENTKEAVLAAAGEDTAMRFDGVTVDADTRADRPTSPPAGSTAWSRARSGRRPSTACRRRPREAAAGDWVFRIGAVRVGDSMYRLIFADRSNGAAIDQALQRDARLVPPHDARRSWRGSSRSASTSSRCARARPSATSRRGCRGPSASWSCSGC